MNWYILFVKTGKEERVEYFLRKQLDTDTLLPFIPMQETLFKISGQVRKELKPLFPSYVFIESEEPGLEVIKSTSSIISASSDIIRYLRYGDSNEIAMREDEKAMLMSLCNDDRCIESSTGIIEGNNVYIKEGPLKGMESIIKKIDRHKRRAIINLDFMGAEREVSVALEIVEKI